SVSSVTVSPFSTALSVKPGALSPTLTSAARAGGAAASTPPATAASATASLTTRERFVTSVTWFMASPFLSEGDLAHARARRHRAGDVLRELGSVVVGW